MKMAPPKQSKKPGFDAPDNLARNFKNIVFNPGFMTDRRNLQSRTPQQLVKADAQSANPKGEQQASRSQFQPLVVAGEASAISSENPSRDEPPPIPRKSSLRKQRALLVPNQESSTFESRLRASSSQETLKPRSKGSVSEARKRAEQRLRANEMASRLPRGQLKTRQQAKEQEAVIYERLRRANQAIPPFEFLNFIGKGSYGRVYVA